MVDAPVVRRGDEVVPIGVAILVEPIDGQISVFDFKHGTLDAGIGVARSDSFIIYLRRSRRCSASYA